MSLKVKVDNCKDLPNFEKIGLIDPYVVLTFRSIEKKTSVIDDNVNPVWEDEEFEWTLQTPLNPSESIKIEVYDEQTIGKNRLVGNVDYAVSQLWGQKNKTECLKLNPSKHAKNVKDADKATITLTMVHISLSEQVTQRGGNLSPLPDANGQGQVNEGSEAGGDFEAYGDVEEGYGGDVVNLGVNVPGGAPSKKRVRHPKLPDKPMDFQIRIHVIEGRKFEGNNISPLVKVVCDDEFQQTSSRKGTNSPVYDETMIFNFKQRPVELFEKKIEFKVLNAGKKKTIGVFSIDIGTVYLEPKHTFLHKWLLLTHKDDPSLGARGFLKVTLSVLGPNDDPVHSTADVSSDSLDIESNLLRPSGVRLQEATLSVKIYAAEDLPQMDPDYLERFKSILNIGTGKKELVDPFATVAYAGHKVETEVKWNTQNPHWNEQVNIGFRFPSICDKVRIELKDKDKLNADDYIGTCFLNIPEISAPGDNGFLPIFGPSYVNIYGSPREFTDLPDKFEDLNKGLSDGVAYRGRILLELGTSLGRFPKERKEFISHSEQRKLLSFQGRQKYVLFAAFMSASMIQTGKNEVQFEVSIGNYGQIGDKSVVVQASTTQSTYPNYDGRNYSYMPWHTNKPLVLLESYWEDCYYRIQSQNLFANAANKLSKGLESVQRLMHLPKKYSDLVPERLSYLCHELVNDVISCKVCMPKLPEVYNKLDKQLRKHREIEIAGLCATVDALAANESMSVEERLSILKEVLEKLKTISIEPQNSIPDVIIWMLVDGKRTACKRIPSYSLMYSDESATRGSLCGKMQTLQLIPPTIVMEKELDGNKNSCLLQVFLWLGTEANRMKWCSDPDGPGGELTTLAETYENEAFYGVWGSGKKLTRPHWSDATGKIKLNKEYFEPPPTGWVWEGDWFLDSEDFESDKMDEVVTVDIYEIQSREKFAPWPNASLWADTSGLAFMNFNENSEETPLSKDDIDRGLPEGWDWTSTWKVDTDGPVTSDGWEYSAVRYDPDEGLPRNAQFAPTERNDHMMRRRKWIRTRQMRPDSKIQPKRTDHWMYARHPSSSYHSRKGTLDFFRRRRWHRSLTCEEIGRPAVFYILRKRDKRKRDKMRKLSSVDGDDIGMDSSGFGYQFTPRMYLKFKESAVYQLRAYLYQARNLYAADNTGLSDPYVIVTCGNVSARSQTIMATLSPKWSETLCLDNIRLYGSPRTVVSSPPLVALELYDKDILGQNEFLGMVMVPPVVRMTQDTETPVLEWLPIIRYGQPAGEILAAFELILIKPHGWTPPKLQISPENCYLIPDVIRPVTERTRIEVLCWGVRDMKRYHLLPVNHPFVEVECGSEYKRTSPIKNMNKNPLFPQPVLTFDTELPVEDVYSPPLNIQVFDQRKFGYAPLVGNCTIPSLNAYKEQAPQEQSALQDMSRSKSIYRPRKNDDKIEFSIDIEKLAQTMSSDEDDYRFDWWSKYYASFSETSRVQEGYLEENNDKLIEYSKELETYFNDFSDIAQTFSLHRGKGQQNADEHSSSIVGYFKGAIKVYPIQDQKPPDVSKFMTELPIKWPIDVCVRVYVIRGFDLQPKDIGGGSDPYIKITAGKKEVSDKENFIANQLNPIFGKVFEIDCTLPFDRTLTVTVMDHDYLSSDDLIGSTVIDLENRFLSHHRPICGIPATFSKAGCNRWRDMVLPVDLLETYCKWREIHKPRWNGTTSVIVDNQEYTLEQFENGVKLPTNHGDEKNRLALHILRTINIVPEHVEKRTLYTSLQPGVPQGQLHMWVDVFPKTPGVVIPPKVDITPRKPEKHVLRVIIWNTSDVILDERSLGTQDSMSDIYVKGWLTGSDDEQKTDVHYRSMDGDGMFNWRLVFPIDYLRPERKMIEHFYSLSKTERRLPVNFNLQVWDNDLLSADDFLGKVEFDLHNMPLPSKKKSRCRLRLLNEEGPNIKRINLFEQKHVKGWLPVFQEDYEGDTQGRDRQGNRTLTVKLIDFYGFSIQNQGKVELEMQILTEEEAEACAAGKGRDEPNQNPHLADPDRPALSFAWFASPLKTFKFIVWRHHKKKLILGIILLCILIPILLLF